MKIPWIDLSPQTNTIREELLQVWNGVLDRAAFSGGEQTVAFEQDWARYLGVRHAIGCSDGTSAIVLALRGVGIGPGDEVLTAPTSYYATAEAIALAGATPRFADVDEHTANLDPEAVEAAITPRTRAIVAVHLAGRPAPMAPLRTLADKHGLKLLEDAAQAHGAVYQGRRAGSLGDAASFSFYPTKNLGAMGEGGAVVTSDDAVAAKVRALRDHGQTGRHRHEFVGYNARLDGLQGAALRLKLPHLDRWNEERRVLAARYREGLAGLPLGLPPEGEDLTHVYHLYPVRTPRREALVAWLGERNIGVSSHYPTPIHLQPAFAHLGYVRGSFPRAERYAHEQLTLPIFPGLPLTSVDAVCEAIRAFFDHHGER